MWCRQMCDKLFLNWTVIFELNSKILLLKVSTLTLGMLRLESILVLDKICGEDYISCFFSFYFSKMYFYYKIESIWVILALLLNLGKIVFGCVEIDHGMERAGFPGCWSGCIQASELCFVPMHENSLWQTVVLHQVAARALETIPFPKRVSTPVFIFVHQTFKMVMAD